MPMLQKMKEMGIQSARSLDASTKLPTQLSHTLDMLNEGEISLGAEMNMPKDLKSTVYSLTGYLAFALISAGLFIGFEHHLHDRYDATILRRAAAWDSRLFERVRVGRLCSLADDLRAAQNTQRRRHKVSASI